eukprot:g5514.t1
MLMTTISIAAGIVVTLRKRKFLYKDESHTMRKIKSICDSSKCIVVTDFDHTMTGFRTPRNEKVPQCHDAIEKSKRFADVKGWKCAWDTLWENQKKEYGTPEYEMATWWKRAHSILIKHGFRKSDISTLVDEYENIIHIRDGIREIFQLCEKKDIPIVIVSAGITDFIREILRRKGIDVSSNRVVICSNEMIFNKDGLLERFTSPVVHAESKGKIRSLRKEFFERYKDRTNVILMGDSICDPEASQNIFNKKTCISIGFLDLPNEDGSFGWRHKPLSVYSDVYDILIPDDGSARCVVGMINNLK